jgi:nucleotide-binding universal stress UspA family protein
MVDMGRTATEDRVGRGELAMYSTKVSDVPTHEGVLLKNILFAMDFSPSSLLASPFALGLAQHYDGRVVVAHILLDEEYHSVSPTWEGALETMETDMEETLSGPLGSLRDIPHEAVFDHGDVRSQLAAIAARCRSELIVLGTHGRRGIKKLIKGSTAEGITYSAGMPALMVGPKVTRRFDFKRILYACDIFDCALYALPYALSLAETYNADLILHVNGWGLEGPVGDAVPEFIKCFREQVEQRNCEIGSRILESLRNQLHCYSYLSLSSDFFAEQSWKATSSDSADVVVDFLSPAERILELIADRQIDLVVTSVDGKRGIAARFAAHLPGSSAYAIASEANCPVLAVPPPEALVGRGLS